MPVSSVTRVLSRCALEASAASVHAQLVKVQVCLEIGAGLGSLDRSAEDPVPDHSDGSVHHSCTVAEVGVDLGGLVEVGHYDIVADDVAPGGTDSAHILLGSHTARSGRHHAAAADVEEASAAAEVPAISDPLAGRNRAVSKVALAEDVGSSVAAAVAAEDSREWPYRDDEVCGGRS